MSIPCRTTTGLAIAVVFLLVFSPILAAANGNVFTPTDKTSPTNPCPPAVVPNDVYDKFRKLLSDLLGSKAGVVSDIDSQVKGKVPDDKEKPVSIEIEVVTKDQFKTQYANDVDKLYPDKTADQLKNDAENFFNANAAYTYITDNLDANGVQKIKIKVFCKDSLRTATIDKSPLLESLIHELVHAKLYTMLVLGLTDADLPFLDHADKFFGEIKRLFDLLKKNLELSFSLPFENSNFFLVELGEDHPSDGVVSLDHQVTAIFETQSVLGNEITFKWINPSKEIVRTEIKPLELMAQDTFVPNSPGHWTVVAESLHMRAVVASFDVPFSVIPESPIGIIVLMASSLAALGGFMALRRSKGTTDW
ncbi:MAG: hypothetical protein AUH71_04150 [Thaumarchaeota archaeon 13_1_40CM_4_48_7]|nr:MAG: hypothetical protein AUH71_04150 [Thaumarchaeota archaeon 13_1_40CM_4_48_7]